MNNVNLERIPLPRFSTYLIYTAVSLIGSMIRICYVLSHTYRLPPFTPHPSNVTLNNPPLLQLCIEDTWFFWSVINFAYCLLICLGRKLQHFFFGELRETENSHIRDNLSNFIFYKVVFVYGILNVEALHELLLWAAWFSVLGFLHLLAALAKDRFEFLMQSPDAPLLHMPLLILLCTLLFLGNVLMAISIAVGTRYSIHLMFFMLAEVFQLAVRTIHVIAWYAVQIYSEITKATDVNGVYQKSKLLYYVELIFFSVTDLGDLVHNIHLALWNHLRVSMSGIIVGMHLQHLYYKLSKRYHHHLRYRRILTLLDNKLKLVQLPDQDCVVCWEKLNEARELPCGHVFHAACLHMWLERSAHCPTCRSRLASVDAENTPVLEPELWNEVPTVEASAYVTGHFTETNPRFTRVSSEPVRSHSQDVQRESLQMEPAIEPCSSCSSHTEYNGSSGNLFFSDPDYGGGSSSMSAMVSIHRLLDVHNDSRTGTAGGVGLSAHSCSSLLPAKFVDALETELIHYFQPKESLSDSNTNDLAASESESPVHKRVLFPTAPRKQRSGSSVSPNVVERQSGGRVPIVTSNTNSGSSSEEYVEFPPKRVLRMVIRHLIHRVTQAVTAARTVGAHVTSQTSSSSDDECVHNNSHGPVKEHVQKIGCAERRSNSVFGSALSEGEACGRFRRPHSEFGVFHDTRTMREQSLKQRKLAIIDQAKRNFLEHKRFALD